MRFMPKFLQHEACSLRQTLSLLGALLICFCVDGCTSSIGIMISYWSTYFDVDAFVLSWISSIQVFCTYALGPLAGSLIGRFGITMVAIAGGVIAAMGHFLTGVIGNFVSLYLLFGVIVGLGYGLLYMSAIVAVTTGFNEFRPMAMGIMACGSGIGASVHSILYPMLEAQFTWRGLCILTAGVLLHTCVFGCLLGLMLPQTLPPPAAQVSPIASASIGSADSTSLAFLGSGFIQLPENTDAGSAVDVSQSQLKTTLITPKLQHLMGSLGSFTYLVEIEKLVHQNGLFGKGRPLHKNAAFLVYIVGVTAQAIGSWSPLILLFDMLLADGLTTKAASSIVALSGVFNAFARLFFGTVSTIPCISKTWLLGIIILIGGAVNVGLYFIHVPQYFQFYACICGVCLGKYCVLKSC